MLAMAAQYTVLDFAYKLIKIFELMLEHNYATSHDRSHVTVIISWSASQRKIVLFCIKK